MSDDFDSSRDGSVGPEIGRSGERNSIAPPILSICAGAGRTEKVNQSQPSADDTRRPIPHHCAVATNFTARSCPRFVRFVP